ncbi:DUF6568 family protein [Candidatus Ruminimicrobium bovinum]|uniref:DUF6568 family protein n=1 Tax=Candidatus Ruminimicrobium bovinum TaxID=3242779 RepID=UPI0039B9B69E
MKQTNKIYKIVIFGVIGVMLIVCAVLYFKDEKTIKLPQIYNYLNSITYDNFQNSIDNKDTMILYVGRPDCPDCNNFDDDLLDIIKKYNGYDKVWYLNIQKQRQDEKEWKKINKKYKIKYTPTFILYDRGKYKSKVEWTPEKGIDYDEVDLWFKNTLKQ